MMSTPKPKFLSSFTALNFTQFFAALNDNLYKLILIFFVISVKGEEHSNTILSLAGAIFVIPFILFAPISGIIADRYSKRTIIYLTRLCEILTMTLGVISFIFKSIMGGYAVLFLTATYSSLFSPCKYGIIPEIVPKQKIPRCNGAITAATFLAIILGTFFASFISDISNRNFVLAASFCVIIAVAGTLFSLRIEKTQPQAPRKKFSLRFFTTIYRSLKKARKSRYLFVVLIFGAYFLFIGAYTQLNIIPFAIQALDLSEIQGGYLFLMTAIGIGIGSFLAGRFSVFEVELGFVPIAATGIGLCLIGLFFLASHLYAVIPLLILIGLFGGFYVVPIDAFIQIASPQRDRGQNVAASNFLSFIGVIIASGLIAFFGNLLNMTAASGFFIVGILTLIMGLTLVLLFADQLLRLIVAVWAKFFCTIHVIWKKRIDPDRPTLLVAPRTHWLDTVVVMATLPRLIRYIVPIENGKKQRPLLYRLLWLIPLDIEHFSPIGKPALEAIRKELRAGHSVCLMQPVDMPAKNLKEWEKALEGVLQDIEVPIMPIHISRKDPSKPGRLNALKSLMRGKTRISYGNTQG